MYLGREVMGTHLLPVWAMPRMAAFLRDNGPWSLLVKLQNIALQPVEALEEVHLGASLVATPILVPHRDEFTETVAWRIQGPHHAMLWLPDIDGWDRWDRDLPSVLATVDVAYLDGTFFADGELQRDMSDIPHPRIRDTLARIASLPPETRAKVRFVHLNHTNPALDPASPQSAEVAAAGSRVAAEGERFDL
jgi:pyrroloquinoline quinone biosynthesis protein B